MNIELRKTLLGYKLVDFEEHESYITFYLENENGLVFAINIKGEYQNTFLIEEEE